MLSRHDIILISSIEWDFNWQGHQEIARRLAQAGNRVLYIENMGVRPPGLHDVKRVALRFAHWAKSLPSGGVREVSPNLYVCSPLILPPFGSKMRHQLNQRALLPLIRRIVRNLRFDPEVIWTFLPTDTVAALIRMLSKPRGVVVYYCIADFAELALHPEDILMSEHSIIEMSDVVFAQSQRLAEHCSQGGKKVAVFPFGVNLDLFAKGNGHPNGSPQKGSAAATAPANDLASDLFARLPRPIIGYVGGIHRFFDAEMLAAMARARPEWSWVLVGPLQTSPRELKRIPNVHLLGPKPHEELPYFIRHFDVGIVPYLSTNYTATVVPTKINEYLAMGKPVVSTDLPEVNTFNGKHEVIITSPNDSTEFVASIERALDSSAEEAAVARRRTVAALNDWEDYSERMSYLIQRELRKKSLASENVSLRTNSAS
jgi:glycosyltransferase involved in cell wall biosynthesis